MMTRRLAYLDSFSGISGDMLLGALLDAGLSPDVFTATISALGLSDVSLHVERVARRGISALHVTVREGHDHAEHAHHSHLHRGLREISGLISVAALPDEVKAAALATFTRLAEAEARVHGTTPEEIHFHEVGATDAIVDIVCTCAGFHALGIERVVCSPLPLGSGWVRCAHGEFPIPAPAVAELLRGVPTAPSTVAAELTTPTGAALAVTLADSFGAMPPLVTDAIGYGAGTKDLERPNVLRLVLGVADAAQHGDEVVLLETNLDSATPEVLGYALDRLLSAGALDAWFTPVQMKKNRPGVVLTALCAPADEDACRDVIFAETPTLGVRRSLHTRAVLRRDIEEVATPYGSVRVKVRVWRGIRRAEPEFEDCRRCAAENNVPLWLVMRAAQAAADYSPSDEETP